MTELETVQRAKMYIDQLAHGIDPISGTELPEDSALNNIRLARCFFYVSGILEQVIQNGGQVGSVQKAEFTITQEQLANVQVSAYPIRISDFTEALNQAVDTRTMKKLRPVTINNWLEAKGFLTKIPTPDGKNHRVPTDAGRNLGITAEMRQSPKGDYWALSYDSNSQRFLLDNLCGILQEQ